MEKRFTLFVLAFFISTIVSGSFFGFEGDDPLKIYPNPAKDFLKIELQSDNSVLPEVQIIDLTGKVVKKFDSDFTMDNEIYKANYDISDMKPGIYFVKLIQGETAFSRKLIVR
ncbi:MAG: T9SS type A sorting domain-containing protein [Bacteroidales bacterium]